MRLYFLATLLALTLVSTAQTDKASFDSVRSLLTARKAVDALPYLKKVMASSDEELKQQASVFVSENWTSVNGGIALSGKTKEFATIAINYLNATFPGKSQLSARDQYTIGMIHWALAYSGVSASLQKSLSYLSAAMKQGYPNAAYYMAQAATMLKQQQPAVPWNDVFDLYIRASLERKSPEPLLELADRNLHEYTTTFGKQDPTVKDTARQVFLTCLETVKNVMPDSFYLAVDRYWGQAMTFDQQDDQVIGLLDYFLRATQHTDAPGFRKGLAWHYLYRYFFDNNGSKAPEARAPIMDTIRTIYGRNDAGLLPVISAFLLRARPNTLGRALSIRSNWLASFKPVTVTDRQSFFQAAASTEQNFIPFMALNQPVSDYTSAVDRGFRRRLDNLLDIAADKEIFSAQIAAVIRYGASLNKDLLKKLASMPGFANDAQMKYNLADFAALEAYVELMVENHVPLDLESLPSLFSGWTGTERKNYNPQYLDMFVEALDKMVRQRRNLQSLGNATGKSMDFNDYEAAQKIIAKLKAVKK
ncbi:MAG: hypothetical protein JWP27_1200 [Flaviaesturariibacter sp.]|nr:hypothetical protein [Flaviaesturariibacter sp.]